MTASVRTERRGRVLEVTIDHPPLNILTIELCAKLQSVLDGELGDARAVILCAAGDRWSGGADVREHLPEQAAPMLAGMRGVVERLLVLPAATIAAVHGDALGGGLELVTACDVAVAARDARLGQPEIKIGCFAPFAAAMLPAVIGAKRAADLLLTGDPITGEQAAAIGLVSESCEAGDVLERARAKADAIARHSRAAIAACRHALRRCGPLPAPEACALAEKIYLEESVPTADYEEGLRAFLEKRPPDWTDA